MADSKGHYFFDTVANEKWSVCPFFLDLNGLCDCFDW